MFLHDVHKRLSISLLWLWVRPLTVSLSTSLLICRVPVRILGELVLKYQEHSSRLLSNACSMIYYHQKKKEDATLK